MKSKNQPKSFVQRLKQNLPAMTGFIIIAIALIISIFGYVIAPDNTPDADLQTIEIQSKQAGYSQLFFVMPADNIQHRNFIASLFFGKPSQKKYLPIEKYFLSEDSLYINKYVDEDTAVLQAYSLQALNLLDKADLKNHFVTKKYLLGTDAFGRDILSRLIVGTRISLAVGFIAVIVSLFLGILLGSLAGYYRGRIDAVIMWFVNVTWSIPTLLLVFAFTLALGKGFFQIFIAVGLTLWVSVARLVRGQVIAVKEQEYVQAAKALGFKDSRIILKHILPNIAGPITVLAAGNFATAIIIEAGLSFLGIGVQPPQPSWGLMIKENYNLIITHNAGQALIPGFAIMLLVLAFNLFGTGLRDLLDVRGKESV